MPKYTILCDKALKELTPDIASVPEADLHPIIADRIKLTLFEDASDAERGIVMSKCSAHHYIVEINDATNPN